MAKNKYYTKNVCSTKQCKHMSHKLNFMKKKTLLEFFTRLETIKLLPTTLTNFVCEKQVSEYTCITRKIYTECGLEKNINTKSYKMSDINI